METTEQLSALITKLEELKERATASTEEIEISGDVHKATLLVEMAYNAKTLLSLARWSLEAKASLEILAGAAKNEMVNRGLPLEWTSYSPIGRAEQLLSDFPSIQ